MFWLLNGGRTDPLGVDTADTRGTILDTGTTANAKGAWVPISASTPRAYDALSVLMFRPVGISQMLVDIGIGASGSETVLIPDLYWPWGKSAFYGCLYTLPVHVPGGSRLAGRAQSDRTNADKVDVIVYGHALGSDKPMTQRVLTLGVDSGATKGVTLDPGTTAHTKPSSWTEITAATPAQFHGIVVGLGQDGLSQAPNGEALVDIALGSAGSETVLVENLAASSHVGSDAYFPTVHPVPVNVPAGARLSARAQSSDTGSARNLDVIVYGLA